MQSIRNLTILGAAVLLIGGFAYAHGGSNTGFWGGPMHSMGAMNGASWGPQGYFSALNLTAEQRTQIQQIITTQRTETIKKTAQIGVKQVELRSLLSASDPNSRQIERKLSEIQDLQREVEMSHLRTRELARAVLTVDQRAMYDDAMPVMPMSSDMMCMDGWTGTMGSDMGMMSRGRCW